MRPPIWPRTALVFFAVGAAAAGYILMKRPGAGPAEAFTAFLVAGFAGWTGALLGLFLDWRINRRSPLAPLFKRNCDWYYRKRYWFRFAALFGASWVGFTAFAEVLALAVGEKEEALLFFSTKGALVLALFLVVFVVEGALLGAVVDFIRFLLGRGEGNKKAPGT